VQVVVVKGGGLLVLVLAGFDPWCSEVVRVVYTMTMTETNSAGCQVVTVAQITVQPNVIAIIDPIVVCQDAADVVITGQNLGVNPIFNGTGVFGNVFDPAGLAPGIYNITVTSQTTNGCSITGTGTVTINPLPTGIIYTD